MAVWTKYDKVGIKEDVSDIISNISPTKTPFQSSIGKEKVHNTNFQWQEDSLAAAAVNAEVEGFTATEETLTTTTMRTNYTQILSKTIKVSGTNDSVTAYGRAKETAYQLSKASKELKLDWEHAIVGLDTAAVAGSSSVARKTSSYYKQIAAANKEAGGTAAFTEAMLLNNLEDIYSAGGDAGVLMIKPADSLIVAGFAAASGRTRDFGAGKTVMNVVDLYVSPFGEVKVVLNRFIEATSAIVYDPSSWSTCVLRPFMRETLAKTGDNVTIMMVGEQGLKHKNQLLSGHIDAIT